ncbi:addiction module toxin, HicA family [Candidatus Uhrbacteria bacterium]|nr:addiction module toxin, HicA family [Candidatus Uhrbacteria bacterium]
MSPRGVNNWTALDVMKFLKDNNFVLSHSRGSHIYYLGKYGKETRQVCVPFHGKASIKPRTLKSIIQQSGIPKEKWINRK